MQRLGDIDENEGRAPKEQGAMQRTEDSGASSKTPADGASNGHHDDVLGAHNTPLKSIGAEPLFPLAFWPLRILQIVQRLRGLGGPLSSCFF